MSTTDPQLPPDSPSHPDDVAAARARMVAAEDLLRKAIHLVEQGRPMPLSSSVIINRDEVLAVLRSIQKALPEELRAARWLLKEREEMTARAKREGEDIVAAARARAERMVQRSEVVKAADQTARRTLQLAKDKALRMKLETEDWCDHRLAAFEAMLHKTLNTVTTGRQRLQETALPRPEPSTEKTTKIETIFDQDVG